MSGHNINPFEPRPQPGDVILRRVENGYMIVVMGDELGMMNKVYVCEGTEEAVLNTIKLAYVKNELSKS